MREIKIPTNCPICSSTLEQVNSQLFCRNTDCEAQSTKKVEAFIKKMRIKGLGPKSIEKLGFVQPIEIYETSLEDYQKILGEKIGQKVYDEVQNSTLVPFATFLSSLSIPLIGDTASKKIANLGFGSVLEILDHDYIDGIGPKAEENLYTYLSKNYEQVQDLESYMTLGSVDPKRISTENKGKVCITGKLQDFSNRTKAKEFLEQHGYTVTSSVSSTIDYLVDEEGKSSSKRSKAESLGIPIVSINDLIKEN